MLVYDSWMLLLGEHKGLNSLKTGDLDACYTL